MLSQSLLKNKKKLLIKRRSIDPVIYGTSLWNSLQNSIRQYTKLSFKKILKNTILSKY